MLGGFRMRVRQPQHYHIIIYGQIRWDDEKLGRGFSEVVSSGGSRQIDDEICIFLHLHAPSFGMEGFENQGKNLEMFIFLPRLLTS